MTSDWAMAKARKWLELEFMFDADEESSLAALLDSVREEAEIDQGLEIADRAETQARADTLAEVRRTIWAVGGGAAYAHPLVKGTLEAIDAELKKRLEGL
jgi:hypothetical protein